MQQDCMTRTICRMVTYCTIAVFRELLFCVSSPRTDKADCGWLNSHQLAFEAAFFSSNKPLRQDFIMDRRAVINYLKPSWIGTRRGENTYYGTLLCTSTSQAWSPL